MIDHDKIEQAVRLFLEGIGEDVTRECICRRHFLLTAMKW